jgi:hypothetical protein
MESTYIIKFQPNTVGHWFSWFVYRDDGILYATRATEQGAKELVKELETK